MKKLIAGAAICAAIIAGNASLASAHVPDVSATCAGLQVNLYSYEAYGSGNNLVTITVDGVALAHPFDAAYSVTIPWSNDQDHTWSVSVDANRSSGNPSKWDWVSSGKQVHCTEPTTSTTSATTTTVAPTTVAPTTVAPTTVVTATTLPSTTVPSSVPPTSVAPETTSTTAPAVIVTSPPSTTPPAVTSPTLPRTGIDVRHGIEIGIAIVLVASGGFALALARRRS